MGGGGGLGGPFPLPPQDPFPHFPPKIFSPFSPPEQTGTKDKDLTGKRGEKILAGEMRENYLRRGKGGNSGEKGNIF